MTRKLIPFALSALAAVALAVPAAQAQPQRGPGEGGKAGMHAGMAGHKGPMRGHRGGMMTLRQLDLTEEQQVAVRALFEQHRAERQGVREQHQELRRQLRELSQQPDADATEVGRLTLQLEAQRQEARASMTALKAQIQDLLTPEQLERYQALEQERQQRFEQRREGRGEGFREGRPHGRRPGHWQGRGQAPSGTDG
jgi:periplasmic protein CpxP/Spy